jgi:hypothetical protein
MGVHRLFQRLPDAGWAPGGGPSGGAEAAASVKDYLFDAGASNMGWLRIGGNRRACVMLPWQGW